MSAEPTWMAIARGEIGVAEVVGPKGSNTRIEEYQAVAGTMLDDDVPWCSAFVNWTMAKAGLPTTRSGAARSWARYGKSVGDARPVGAIVVLWREIRDGSKGHVGFHVGPGRDARSVLLLGGNQSNRVCIHEYPLARVLDFRWPLAVAI